MHMSTAPLITIFVRHSADCKYAGDEFSKRCNCRKHLRWSHEGKQRRRKAGTRSWSEAEAVKSRILAQLTGQAPPDTPAEGVALDSALEVFNADKANQGLTSDIQGRYTRELARLKSFCEGQGVFTV